MALLQQDAIDAIVGSFVEQALPDAHDPERRSYRLFDEGQDGGGRPVYFVEADIPTSASDCWLDFGFVMDEEGRPIVTTLFGMRSGTGDDSDSVYVWDERNGSWQLAPND